MSVLKIILAMGTTVEIIFDKANKTYLAGETIHGKVVVQSDDEKHLRLIKGTRVRCKGTSTIDLKFGIAVDEAANSLSTVSFVDEDAKVLTEQLKKSQMKKGSSELITYEYPFKFTLSKDLPSSFKSGYGRMEYFLKASVPSGASVSYFEGRGIFNVIGILDLNTRPGLSDPVELRQTAQVKTLLTEGTVNFLIRLPQKGYAIGDKILLHQEVVNNCKQSITASISLIQKVSYELGHLLKLEKENKTKVFGKEIPPNSTDICDQEIFEIPPVPVTSVVKLKDEKNTCKIEYFLKYEIVAKPLWLKKFKGYIPLVVGSIPFKKSPIPN